MRFESGVRRDIYPLRAAHEPDSTPVHSIAAGDFELRSVQRMFAEYRRAAGNSTIAGDGSVAALRFGSSRKSRCDRIARAFARFADALDAVHQLEVSRLHLASAWAMLHRRAEGVAQRIDRVIVAGLVSTALADERMDVHVVVDGQWAIAYTQGWLQGVFEHLDVGFGVIQTGDDEAARRRAYERSITLVSSRECAMDFLRDAHHWPERGDASVRTIDRLLGRRARRQATLLQGLPCAVLVDIDSVLIDNARTPIVLTRDAHPMHELEELQRALQMVDHLQSPVHFIFDESDAEVRLTRAGAEQLRSWGEQLGGIWAAPHVAGLMLAAAIVVVRLVRPEVHYRIEAGSVHWLVGESLVPGMTFYSRAFITRFVEIKEQCNLGGPREVIGRASYQQVFNRYLHLCGVGHRIEPVRRELRSIYGLKGRDRGRDPGTAVFRRSLLMADGAGKMQWLVAWLGQRAVGECVVVTANSIQRVDEIREHLGDAFPRVTTLVEPQGQDLTQLLVPGSVVVALAQAMDYLVTVRGETIQCPVRVVVTQRSTRICEDRRNLFWLHAQGFEDCHATQLLAADDELFEEVPIRGLLGIVRRFGVESGGFLLERLIRRIQVEKAGALYRVRRDLMNYDTSMQGLLSFSGRGMYE